MKVFSFVVASVALLASRPYSGRMSTANARLKAWREEKALSLRQASALLRVTHTVWQGWEAGSVPGLDSRILLEALTPIKRDEWQVPSAGIARRAASIAKRARTTGGAS